MLRWADCDRMKLYRIANWHQVYETHDTRKLKVLRWVPTPNDFDGTGFRLMAREKDGAALFGAWNIIIRTASRSAQGNRGVLIRNGQPHSAQSLSITSGLPVSVFERALAFFSQPLVGWLTAEEWQNELPLSPGETGASPGETGFPPAEWKEWNGRNGKKEVGASGGARQRHASALSDADWLQSLQSSPAYKGVNVTTEYAKMQEWCAVNRKSPTRRRFVNWLNRADHPISADLPRQATSNALHRQWERDLAQYEAQDTGADPEAEKAKQERIADLKGKLNLRTVAH